MSKYSLELSLRLLHFPTLSAAASLSLSLSVSRSLLTRLVARRFFRFCFSFSFYSFHLFRCNAQQLIKLFLSCTLLSWGITFMQLLPPLTPHHIEVCALRKLLHCSVAIVLVLASLPHCHTAPKATRLHIIPCCSCERRNEKKRK